MGRQYVEGTEDAQLDLEITGRSPRALAKEAQAALLGKVRGTPAYDYWSGKLDKLTAAAESSEVHAKALSGKR